MIKTSDAPPALHDLTIAQAGRLLQRRDISPVELVEASLRRIEALDYKTHAFITVTADLAREQAQVAEREIGGGNYRSPLHGIPFGLKDIFNTKGVLSTGGSKVLASHIPTQNATVVDKLYQAGGILVGKQQTHEMAHGGPSFDTPWPPSRNPWNLRHFTGGSSSGSAAAVAGRLVPAALGSDTGGSIRGPSGHCGITGLMPTYGIVSRAGMFRNSYTFDHAGPMARTAEDCAILLQSIVGYDPNDSGSVDRGRPRFSEMIDGGIKGLRIGVLRSWWESELKVGEDHSKALNDAVRVFSDMGAIVENCATPSLTEAITIKIIIAESELFNVHRQTLINHPEDFGRVMLERVLPGCLFQSTDFVQALRKHRRYVARMKPLFQRYDVLLAPGVGAATVLEEYPTLSFWKSPNFLAPFNLARCPTLALPCGFSQSGLPLGMQLCTKPYEEARLLRAGHAYQKATDWHMRVPNLEDAHPVNSAPVPSTVSAGPQLTAVERDFVVQAAKRAGLQLGDDHWKILFDTAPYALEMVTRIHRPADPRDMPSLVYQAPA